MIPAVYPLAALVIVLALLAMIRLAPYCRAFRRVPFLLLAVASIIYGGSKWSFSYQLGLADAGSYCTNDLIHAAWTWQSVVGDYEFKWQYRNATITNDTGSVIDPWHELPGVKVSDGVAEATVPDATNMQVVCWAEHVPPIHVITNGVYHLNGVMRAMGDAGTNDWITPGIRIIDGPRHIAPPTARPPVQSVPSVNP